MKINRFHDLLVFVTAAKFGNFSDAAREMGMSPVVAAAVIKRLETNLGVRLFERSTRRVRLSDAGERYLPHAREALQALAWGEAALGQEAADEGRLVGPLRLGMPSDLGRGRLIGWIEEYIAQQNTNLATAVTLEVRISDRISNLLQQPIDFAFRYGLPADSGFVALPIAPDNRRVLCAAPAYLARHGTPQTPDDLRSHQCLRFILGDALHSRWHFESERGPHMVEVQGDRIADDGGVVRQWALDGLGITYKSHLDVAADLAAGRLQLLLPQWRTEPAPLFMLVVSKQRLNAGVRALAAALAKRCQELLQGSKVKPV